MSVLVAKLFQADMSDYEFVFSKVACIKTCIYFAIMYFAVMIFNTITISRYKLINLLSASKKNETVKIKNPIIAILVFLIGTVMLGYAYYQVTSGISELDRFEKLSKPVLLGVISTVLIFWSLSGFILKIIQTIKNVYLHGTNMFILRQINNKINTTVISMSVICLMLFMTITVLSSSLSLRNTMQKELEEVTPVDINLYKTANLPESKGDTEEAVTKYSKEKIEASKESILETLTKNGLDKNILKDIVEVETYADKNLTFGDFFGDKLEGTKQQFPMLRYETLEDIMKVSDYNKIARLYNIPEYELNDGEFIMICDYKNMVALRDDVLSQQGYELEIFGKKYKSKYDKCMEGYTQIANSHVNIGIILLPDNVVLKEEDKESYLLAANYNVKTDDKKQEIEENFMNKDSALWQNLDAKGIKIDGMTKIIIIESSVGLGAIITFIAIYLGIVFLIASSAILALKQLTESSDNKQRYAILRRIGCDEKIINKTLFWQIGIFFILPLILAIIHSIFGIKFVILLLQEVAEQEALIPSIIITTLILSVIYGAYFLATYQGSKTIIKED